MRMMKIVIIHCMCQCRHFYESLEHIFSGIKSKKDYYGMGCKYQLRDKVLALWYWSYTVCH